MSNKVLEAVKRLLSEVSINVPDVCIGRAHRVSRTDDTVIVRFTTFCHCTMFYRKRKELKNGLNKSQIRPTDQSDQICIQFFPM